MSDTVYSKTVFWVLEYITVSKQRVSEFCWCVCIYSVIYWYVL